MAISDAIVATDPDGSVIHIKDLDDATRTSVRQVTERMEDSLIDTTGGQTWASTTTKKLKAGIARIETSTFAAIPAFAQDGKLWIEDTAPSNTNAFKYDTSAAWVDVPVGTANLLAAAVTKAKMGAASVHIVQTELTNSTNDTRLGVTPIVIGTVSGTVLTFTLTPQATGSWFIFVLQCSPRLTGGAAADHGIIRIQNTTAPATIGNAVTNRQDKINAAEEAEWMTLVAFDTGRVGAQTYQAQMAGGSAGQTINLHGDALVNGVAVPARFMAIEVMF